MRARKNNITRREFCEKAAIAGITLLAAEGKAQVANKGYKVTEVPGSWPAPRQNRHLTGVQPLAGRMKSAPKITAKLPFAKGPGFLRAISTKPNGPEDRILAIANGKLRCYHLNGSLAWETHPAGLNFTDVIAVEDIDGDGHVELALMAGRPTAPLGAAVVLAADTGKLRFRYDVEPMSYWWTMQVGHYLTETGAKQLVVCEHGYPPDAKFGYIALFAFDTPGAEPKQRWRYDFDHYTCFPTLYSVDVDGDGHKELCVETHSKMWMLNVQTGQPKQFVEWDVAPASVRSYGLTRFQDLNGDGLPEFFCIANFAQHHEVLVNEKGTLKKAWAHCWNESVTTGNVVTTWAEPPIADVDGDGKLEMVVSMYNSEEDAAWKIRIYDAMTGVLKTKIPNRIATQLADVDGDGFAEILADVSTDATRTTITGVCLLKPSGNDAKELWNQTGARSAALPARPEPEATKLQEAATIVADGASHRLAWEKTQGVSLVADKPAPKPTGPDFSHVPSPFGLAIEPPLVADVDGDGKNEVIHFHDNKVTIYKVSAGKELNALASFSSNCPPALADVDGDGRLELLTASITATTDPIVTARKVGPGNQTLWEVTLKRPDHVGIPYPNGRKGYFQIGRFTGRAADDVYFYVGTPIVRSIMLDGRNGAILWEKGELKEIERYYGVTTNLASVWDVDGDGKDDLIFTCPDYYCVASGPTGDPVIGPLFPPKIFNQPSQGLYTMPALLPNSSGEPTVCLVNGHYFMGGMTVHAKPLWYKLPVVGVARAGSEGFAQTPEGKWLLGYGQQDGTFTCLDVETGKPRWTYALEASASDVCACDIDGDGRQEFVFGTSHGQLYALADHNGKPHLVWKAHFPATVGAPVIADVDGDGASEIVVALGDGTLCLLSA